MNRIRNNNILLKAEKVEWTELGLLCRIKAGDSLSSKLRSESSGEYPVINSSKKPIYFVSEWNTSDDPIGIVRSGKDLGTPTWYDGKYFRGSNNYSCTILDRDLLLDRFLYYILSSKKEEIRKIVGHGLVPTVQAERLKVIKIPIPPITVQSRIASMLDDYTTDLENFVEALEGEKITRKQEYEYYRDRLVSF